MAEKIVGASYPRLDLERGDLFSHGQESRIKYVVISNVGEKSPHPNDPLARFVCRDIDEENRHYKYTDETCLVCYLGRVNLDDQDNIVEKKGKKMKKAKINPVQKATMDLIIAEVKKRTEEAYGGQKEIPDTKEQKIADLIESTDWGCRYDAIKKILGLVLDKELPPARIIGKGVGGIFKKVGIAIVPLSDAGGHNYLIGKAILTHAVGSSICLRFDGAVGNNMATEPKESRAATDREIDEFFRDYPMDRLHQVFEHDIHA